MGHKSSKYKWDEAFEKDLKASQDITKKTFDTLVSSKDDMSAAQRKLPEQVRQDWSEYNKANETFFLEMFKKYDENGDGVLDKKEVRALTKEALAQQKKFIPKLIQSIMKSELMGIFNISSAKSAPVSSEQQEEAFRVLEKAFGPMEKHVKAYIDDCIAHHEEVADQLWELMDSNHDGSVTQKEFTENFLKYSKITLFNGAELQKKCHEIWNPEKVLQGTHS